MFANNPDLFDRNGFRQVARFVYIGAACEGDMVGKELHGDSMHDGGQFADVARCADNVHTFGGIKIAVEVGKDEKFAAARADFLHIGFDFVQQAVVGCDDDDGHIFVH